MQLDHITIVASDCACLRDFFVEVAGMEEGARPAFGVAGHWLYLGRLPVLHLIERPEAQADVGVANGRPAARIDHMALRIDSAPEWQKLLRRLRERQVPYQLSGAGALQERQLFVTLAPAVTVEFVIAAEHLA
jgi:extradiol dioxygenase family protein